MTMMLVLLAKKKAYLLDVSMNGVLLEKKPKVCGRQMKLKTIWPRDGVASYAM